MKKRIHKKKAVKSSSRKHPSMSLMRFIIISLGVLILVFGVRGMLAVTATIHVLGVATGPVPVLLADHGSEDSGSGGSLSGGGDSSSGGSGSGTSGFGTNGGSTVSSNGSIAQSGGAGSVSQDMQVDCVGPDGKHFTTSFHDCQEMNQKWGNASFTFTPLSSSQHPAQPEIQNNAQQPEPTKTELPQGSLQVQTEGNKGEVDLQTSGLHVQIKREDDGSVHLTAQKPDGTEINLESNALDKLNEDLKDTGIEVASSSSSTNNLVLRKGGVEAETELPISVDPTTHELTVTTPAGEKAVTVLPDAAVQNVLASKTLSSIETQASTASGTVSQTTQLTEVNNQPVFAVNGISQKNVLGLFPVGFAKTVLVSATNGTIIQVNETLLNRILEALSF